MTNARPMAQAVWLLLTVFDPPAAAQTQPMPQLPGAAGPSQDPPAGHPGVAGPPAAEPLASVTRLRAWEYSLGVGARWDGNIDFLSPDGPRGLALIPRGGLARAFSGPHGHLRATATGGWTGYPEVDELNRHNGEARLEGRYGRSPATEWQASASYGFGQGDSSRLLLEQGVSLPMVDTRTVAAALGVSKLASRRSLRLGARYYRTDFDAPGLVDGESFRGTAGLGRQLSSRDTLGLEYSLEQARSERVGRSYLTHYGSVQWTRLFSARTAVLLEAGASYTPQAARAGLDQQESFFGGASFTRRVRRSSVTAFLRHEVTPAFGSGLSRAALRSGLGATIPIGRSWELRATGTHVLPDNAGADRLFGPTADAFVALGVRLGRHLELTGETRYRRRGETPGAPAIESLQAGVFLTLASPAGRALAPLPGP